ncbi:chondroitinase family polysaccharide lyase [Nonomuraea sp. NBC_01738]|uniref:chondroitinase family polysaccharide lyase n=1 Tax=Nonomuraea sp. NBC_01738 TaxID=2976003 RepID=UPI002E100E7B|nr:chondroitinase family polysaccharide lyase [Nonomuraea sp. NBC_01738]
MAPEITRRSVLAAGMAAPVLLSARPSLALPADLEGRAMALDPPVFLLESAVPPHFGGAGLAIGDQVAVCGSRSLRWEHAARGVITVRAPLRWAADPYRPGDDQAWQGLVDAFCVWVHNATPVDDVLRFEFGRGDRTDLWFEFRLGFSGWRTAWLRYAYDMRGRPHPDMDTLRIIAPRRAGVLHLDQLMLNVPLRPDAPNADYQIPDNAPEGDEYDNQHWQALYTFDRLLKTKFPEMSPPTPAEADSLAALKARYLADYLVTPVTADVPGLTAQTAALLGRPTHAYQSQIYPPEIAAELKAFVNPVTLRAVTDLMRAISLAHEASPADRPALAALYLKLVDHLRQQGWTEGSGQGTIHHLGYDTRGYYDSAYLMRDALRAAGRLEDVRADLDWLTGLGRLFRGFGFRMARGSVMDLYNTTVRGMLAAILLRDTPAEQVAYLRVLRDWLGDTLLPTDGIQDGIKADGTAFHHVGFFPDYVRDGLAGLAPIVHVLQGGAFAVPGESFGWLKRALLAQRIYAGRTQWPISISGRNPNGTTALSIVPFQWLAEHDDEIGAAFLRLLPASPTAQQKAIAQRLAARGVTAEPSPTGAWAYNYAALAVHRRDDWQVTVRGHNRYLWSTEIYVGANWYGRYNTYGQLQVVHKGTNLDSGYAQNGYDWNRRPGTTTIRKPLDLLKGDLTGAIEEMLLTDARFCGAHSIDGRHAMFAMDLREHPKYDGSHRARKSVFLFDDRIVAVGTAIANTDAAHETETTLFQTTRTGSVVVDGQELPFPYEGPERAPRWIVDDKGLGYYLPGGQRVGISRSVQASRNNATEEPTSGAFSTGWIRHGTAPREGRYEYAMVVNATGERMAAFAAAMDVAERAPYRVERADKVAHVVWDRATGITGYALFERAELDGLVRAADTACLIMTRMDGDALVLSVTDPDLRLYGGIDHDQYEKGRYAGHYSPWSRPWLDDPSHPHLLRVTLEGRWRAAGEQPCRVRVTGRRTVVEFETVDGRPTQVRLTPH